MQQLQQHPHVTTLGYEATRGQQQIVGAVLDPEVKRLLVSCMTRYGKTRFVAVGLLLLIENTPITSKPKPKRMLIIASTIKQTNIIRNYMAEMISNNKTLCALVDQPTHSGPEHLKAEMSKERLTFKNGWELLTLTAHGEENSKDPGKQLMGFGGDIIVLDDACLILDAVYTSGISRMLGDSPDSKLITIINPWNMLNFAYRQWRNPTFKKIHVDWRQALQEGRVTEAFLKEQKENLSQYEWDVLYESKFSVESEDTLIRYDWIERATKKQIIFNCEPQTVWGLDVAEQGADFTVLTKAETDGLQYRTLNQQRIDEHETMATANYVDLIHPKKEPLNVDSIGVGAGVYSRLKELEHNVLSVRVSEEATQDKKRYLNKKAERFWHLRTLFEQDLISIPRDQKLMSQLSQMRYEFTQAGKIKIIDPEGKSPDYSDSLMLTLQDEFTPWVIGVEY